MTQMKMNDPIVKKYKIILKTGLHIWAGKWGLKIGGIDTEVIKNPLTGEPYIPWSSIKWKMRALLEMKYGDYSIEEKEKSWKKVIEYWSSINPDNSSNIAKAFWMANKNTKIASRILVSDFELTEDWKKIFKEKWKVDFFEDKSENTVPRFLKWTANPRHIERVPAGVEFEWTIVLTPVEGENGITKEELEKLLNEWLELLQQLGLGGGVSRWNWKIEIKEIEW